MAQRTNPIIIGSRGSDLALWQAHHLQDMLRAQGYASEIRIIKTQGDMIQHISLEKLEGKGFFTKEIEDALLQGAIDVAVHSHKDLPTVSAPGLVIAAVSEREDPAELLLIRKERTDTTLPLQLMHGAVVGTSSSRRHIQIALQRPDIQLSDIRGNVPTRVQKLRDGKYDAIVLAYAGVHRLQLPLDDLHVEKLSPYTFIPAPAQGVLAFQCREEDTDMRSILQHLHVTAVAETIFVERQLLHLFNGGCHMPLGAYCYRSGDYLHAWAVQAADRAGVVRRLYRRDTNAEALTAEMFRRLRSAAGRSVLITSAEDAATAAVAILQHGGYTVHAHTFLDLRPVPFTFDAGACDWLFFTSKTGVRSFFDQYGELPQHVRIAAIGDETAQVIRQRGHTVHFAGTGNVAGTAERFSTIAAGSRVVFAGAERSREAIRDAVRRYANVSELIVYTNTQVPSAVPIADILAFTSPMQADGFLSINTPDPGHTIVAIGETTAQHLAEKGFHNVHVPPVTSLTGMAEYICGML